ncbi:hypothetical protein M432DRAFT_547199 [Thermoascus aurantiacus ATCC 26904]
MAFYQGGDRPRGPSLHNLLKMLLSSGTSTIPATEGNDVPEDMDEPPDSHVLHPETLSLDHTDGPVYVKSPPVPAQPKESLLTRALMNSPDLLSTDHDNHNSSPRDYTTAFPSYPYSNVSGASTAELTSDGGFSPSSSNAASPPLPSHFTGVRPPMNDGTLTSRLAPVDPSESVVEASLGRKRCISFACGRKPDEKPQKTEERKTETERETNETPRRKPTLTFACPSRQPERRRERSSSRRASVRSRPRPSPAPSAIRRSETNSDAVTANQNAQEPALAPSEPEKKQRGIPITGLGRFEPGEETRFHAFASSVDEEDEWVAKTPEYKDKITLDDCMRKEIAIRKLGEEAEAEAQEEEEEAEDEEDDVADEDDSTVHDFSSDDGNESDNEAGFADSDDESDDGSEYEFWAPSTTTAVTGTDNFELIRQAAERRGSNTSIDSMRSDDHEKWLPAPARRGKGSRRPKAPKMRPGTPELPDSTDFVCGTLDEDRPLEAAYKSCMEQRRLSKHIPIPQDIDPSFPTTDPEDNDDLDDALKDELDETARIKRQLAMFDDEALRGRRKGQRPEISPLHSPKRQPSPAPRLLGHSPKRPKSPAPQKMMRSSPKFDQPSIGLVPPLHPEGVNISELVQRPYGCRTKSLPRTPNPFFAALEKQESSLACSPERAASRTREVYTRGPIDIVEGLEKKRQKRKEKFWRQHCRKAAKEQMERRPTPGKGAERMKELGLEAAERCRAYGVGQNAQLVLSV